MLHSVRPHSAEERTFIPEIEFPKVFRRARIYAGIYACVIALSLYLHSILPLDVRGLPNLFGTWLMVVYGLTQHAGLAENVLDHRLNCRTVYMNPIHRFLYWNMNYHVEHHMFPLVPYHALPKLHEAVKDDCPEPYPSLFSAWREIVPAVLRQVKDPAYHVKRRLPEQQALGPGAICTSTAEPDAEGWVRSLSRGRAGPRGCDPLRPWQEDICPLPRRGVETLRHRWRLHARQHSPCGRAGKGGIIECPKHNGRFHLVDGSPARAPVCRGLATYPIRERKGCFINIARPAARAPARRRRTDSGWSAIATWRRSSKNWFSNPLKERGNCVYPGRLSAD